MADEEEFQAADAGGSDTFPLQCSALRKNGFVVIKDRPCKIVSMSTSKTGKHGGAKVHLVAIDIFDGKKVEELAGSTATMMVPRVTKKEYQVLDVTDDGFVSLMTEGGDTKDDLKVPANEVGENLRKAFDEGKEVLVTVQAAMKQEAIMSFKTSAE